MTSLLWGGRLTPRGMFGADFRGEGAVQLFLGGFLAWTPAVVRWSKVGGYDGWMVFGGDEGEEEEGVLG